MLYFFFRQKQVSSRLEYKEDDEDKSNEDSEESEESE
jgi:hypothetical protein